MSSQEDTKTRDDVLQFLDSLDLNSDRHPSELESANTPNADTNAILSFLDELDATTERKPAPDAPSAPSATETIPIDVDPKPAANPSQPADTKAKQMEKQREKSDSNTWLSWGNNIWSTANTAIKTTQSVVESSVKKSLSDGGTARLLEERVRSIVNKESIGKLGSNLQKFTSEFLETIAPPIVEHEAIELWIGTDMQYEGVEELVYREFSRVLDLSLEDSNIIIRKGNEEEDSHQGEGTTELHACSGLDEALRLAEANIEKLNKAYTDQLQNPQRPLTGEDLQSLDEVTRLPIRHNPVFLALQPCISPPIFDASMPSQEADACLFFFVLVHDPQYNIRIKSYSQTIPAEWLKLSYESNEWVEERMADCVKLASQMAAQSYVYRRALQGTIPSAINAEMAAEKEESHE
ncbi:uncharacterized protein VTP21DRAFT_4659 [Calcarisporiella thermophila]|uniref:uncharacterized protein n=1 Tax=Calcarisporiella thermophila TaxID=911321 RepID=UPI0037420968